MAVVSIYQFGREHQLKPYEATAMYHLGIIEKYFFDEDKNYSTDTWGFRFVAGLTRDEAYQVYQRVGKILGGILLGTRPTRFTNV